MTHEAQQIAIHEMMGWAKIPPELLPPITLDLLRELTIKLPKNLRRTFIFELQVISGSNCKPMVWNIVNATIPQRTEAILRAAGKWVEDKV